jgi:hypothetical protein
MGHLHTCSSVSVRSYTYISLYLAVLTWCTNPLRAVTTTTRQLAGSFKQLFKLSRLVVVCLRFLWCQVGKRQLQVYPVYVLHEPCAWQQPEQLANSCNCTVRAAQHASNHLCASPGVYVVQQNLHAPPNCVDMLHKPCTCNRCTSLCMPKGVTQEQCAGMIDHPCSTGKRLPLQPCACSNVKMALKQTLVSAS